MARKNNLIGEHSHLLNKWVEGHAQDQAVLGIPRSAIAELASVDLGFKVTESNIYGSEKSTGVDLGRRQHRRAKTDGDELAQIKAEVAKLREELSAMNEIVGALRRSIVLMGPIGGAGGQTPKLL